MPDQEKWKKDESDILRRLTSVNTQRDDEFTSQTWWGPAEGVTPSEYKTRPLRTPTLGEDLVRTKSSQKERSSD